MERKTLKRNTKRKQSLNAPSFVNVNPFLFKYSWKLVLKDFFSLIHISEHKVLKDFFIRYLRANFNISASSFTVGNSDMRLN